MIFKYCIICCVFIILIFLYTTNYFCGQCENITIDTNHLKNYSAFNPSIYYDGKYNHVLIRLSNLSPLKISSFVNIYLLKNKIESYILYQKMDKNLKQIFDSKIINLEYPTNTVQKSIGLEDARLIKWNNSYYMYGSLWSHLYNVMNIAFVKLNDNFDIEKITLFQDKSTQKNWIALSKHNELFFIKHIYPYELCKYNENNNCIDIVYKNDTLSNDFKNLRGGSPCLYFTYKKFNGYLAITHIRQNGFVYKHQFVVFSSDYPFLPIWKSIDFTIDDCNKGGIEFACGLTSVDDDNVIVTFGRFDCYSKYKIFSYEQIFKLLNQ